LGIPPIDKLPSGLSLRVEDRVVSKAEPPKAGSEKEEKS